MIDMDKLILANCVRQRKSGNYAEIFENLNSLFKKYPHNGMIGTEILKLFILLGEYERAYQLYLKLLKLPNARIFHEAGYLLRLQIGLKDLPVPGLDKIKHDKSPDWCKDYQQKRVDPLIGFKISDLSVQCSDGTVNYVVTGVCGACGQRQDARLYRTFAVWREFLCPVCFARLLLEYEAIKSFLENKYCDLMQKQVYALDDEFRKIQYQLNVDAVKGDVFTMLGRYLNQDYVFILNNFLMKRLKSAHE